MIYKVDIHCHIDKYSKKELVGILNNKRYIVLGASTDYESSKKLLELKKVYPNLKVALGIHPEYPENFSQYEKVEELIKNNLEHISAIGEVGLPYFSLENLSECEKRKAISRATIILESFIKLSKKYELPLILHAVFETAPIALDLLEKYHIKKALFHWFEGKPASLNRIIKNSYLISVSPDVIYNKEYSLFVDKIPIESICLESDGPWEYNGKKGVPSMIYDVAVHLAEKRGVSSNKIFEIGYRNYQSLIGRW